MSFDEQGNFIPTEEIQHYHEPVAPHTGNVASSIVSVILSICFFALLIVGVVEARQLVAIAGVILVYCMLVIMPVAGIVLLAYPLWHKWNLDKIKREHARLDVQAKQEHMEREKEKHEVRMYIAQSRLFPDANGNRPYIFNPHTYEITEVASGNYMQPVPAHLHLEYNNSNTSTNAGASEQGMINAPTIQPPTMDYIISQLQYNALQVCLGQSLTTGQPFVMDLLEGTHYRIMGGSGFGKSCEAAAILEQVTQSNDSEHLQIALLDLEHKTSRLFEDLPHVASLQVGRKRIDCVASNPDEVAAHFGYLRQELDRRKRLSEYELEHERFLLIYVEEFLSLRREVNPEHLEQMMKDFSILALRGRKYGLYLLACAQVDYASKDLRDAMTQFNVNMSFAVKPTAARAAGFTSSDLLKQNFEAKQRGQFVLETTGCSDILLAPSYDVKAKLKMLDGAKQGASRVLQGSDRVLAPYTVESSTALAPVVAPAYEAYVAPIRSLRAKGFNQDEIIEKLWGVKKGSNQKYQDAREVYRNVIAGLDSQSEEM